MRILIEAHHPGDIHFWKYPVKELLDRNHSVLMIARDRDVMGQLVRAYSWIPHIIPKRLSKNNRFPIVEFVSRQISVAKTIVSFKPDVVASLFGSYCQSAKLLGCRNVIFTDSEFQHFNHRIAHPFADEIHTPYCFYKPLGKKQSHYKGIHELSFLDGRRFQPDVSVLKRQDGIVPRQYILIRLSAWNTFHDINQQGIGQEVFSFINRFKEKYKIIISAEEEQLPDNLKQHAMQFNPHDLHHVLAFARFVLTEGASTASEAACLGVPTVFINSTEPRGYLKMLEEEYNLVRNFLEPEMGINVAIDWLSSISDEDLDRFQLARNQLINDHCDVCSYVVDVIEQGGIR